MANNKTLYTAIDRCKKRIAKAKNKMQFSSSTKYKEQAANKIIEQRSKILVFEQQITMNNLQRG